MKRSGNTTRLIDRNIQQLFNTGFTYLYEGRNADSWPQTVQVLHKFTNRMRSEHDHVKIDAEEMTVDGIRCYKIWIVK